MIASFALYGLLLMPGMLRVAHYYFFSKGVLRGLRYGDKPRQRLDLYLPLNAKKGETYPVVIYVTGGAWVAGHSSLGAHLAFRLTRHGVIAVSLDYRNYPQGDALDMLEDVNTGIAWVLSRVHRFGGDPDSVTLVGQSAGGHLAGLALLKQAERGALTCPAFGATPAWSPTRLRAFVGVSGAFDLVALAAHHGGSFRWLLDRILVVEAPCQQEGGAATRGAATGHHDHNSKASTGVHASGQAPGNDKCKRPAYSELSPLEAARRLSPRAAKLLPAFVLIHGTADRTVPAEGTARLSEALKAAGVRSRCVLVPGKTHNAFLPEDTLRGGADLLTNTVLEVVMGSEESKESRRQGASRVTASTPQLHAPLCPGSLCDLAGMVCPF